MSNRSSDHFDLGAKVDIPGHIGTLCARCLDSVFIAPDFKLYQDECFWGITEKLKGPANLHHMHILRHLTTQVP